MVATKQTNDFQPYTIREKDFKKKRNLSTSKEQIIYSNISTDRLNEKELAFSGNVAGQ